MKKVLIAVGVLAVVGGVGFYFYNKNKQGANGVDDTVSSDSSSGEQKSVAPQVASEKPITSIAPKIPVTKKEARKESRADKKTFKADCGRRPILKKKRAVWQACVDSAKSSSFNGNDEFDAFDISSLDI